MGTWVQFILLLLYSSTLLLSMTDSIASLKQSLRTEFLTIRRGLSVEEWQQNSQKICQHLQAAPFFGSAQTVLAYFSFRQEPDLSPLFAIHKHWGFPRCEGNHLVWHSWSPQDSIALQTGAYGILEPSPNLPLIDPNAVDLVLVPAVACDTQGYRLGYGGGFYDRLLQTSPWSCKFTVGIVFDFARVSDLPHESWDQPMQAICTEAGLFFCT